MTQPVELPRIESALRAAEAVGRVVHAVWALARAQLPRVEAVVAESATYLDWVDAVVARLAGAPRITDSPHALHIVIGPERGFCGSLGARIASEIPLQGPVALVGARLAEAARQSPALYARVLSELPGPSSVDDVGVVAMVLAETVMRHAGEGPVVLVHPQAERMPLRQTVLLASEREPVAGGVELYGAPTQALAMAVRESVEARLRLALGEALCVELRARAAAAERAQRAAKDQVQELDLARRVHEQESVTRELLEIVASRLGQRR